MFISIIIFVSINYSKTNIQSKDLECLKSSDCETPMNYLIRSSCPYESACIENKCNVICKHFNQDKKCLKDSDCNCSSYMQTPIKSCSCIEKNCAVVVE